MIIKAAFVDCIKMLEFRKKMLKEVNNKNKNVEKGLQELTKEGLILIMNESKDFYFEDDHIIYTIPLTQQEREKETSDIRKGIVYNTSRVIKWFEQSQENKYQITSYLERHKIKIEGIN